MRNYFRKSALALTITVASSMPALGQTVDKGAECGDVQKATSTQDVTDWVECLLEAPGEHVLTDEQKAGIAARAAEREAAAAAAAPAPEGEEEAPAADNAGTAAPAPAA